MNFGSAPPAGSVDVGGSDAECVGKGDDFDDGMG